MNVLASMSLRKKLILLFLVVLLLTTVTILVVNNRSMTFEKQILAERKSNITLFEIIVDSKLGHLEGFARNYARRSDIISLVAEAQTDTLARQQLHELFSKHIDDPSSMHLVTFTDKEGRTISHAAQKPVVNRRFLSIFVTQLVNEGQIVSGFERMSRATMQDEGLEHLLQGKSGEVLNSALVLRATAPVRQGENVIGTITAGYVLNNEYTLVKGCQEKLNNIEEVAVYDLNHKIASSGADILPPRPGQFPEIEEQFNNSKVWELEGTYLLFSQKDVYDIERKKIGSLVVVESDPIFNNYQFRRKLQLILFFILAILIGGLSLYMIDRHLSKPIKNFQDAISRAENGDFSARVQHTGEDELGQLGECFNSMIDKIEDMVDQERHRREELQLLNDSTKIISVIHDLELLWHLIMERVITVMRVEACSLFLKDPHSGHLECKITGGSGTSGADSNLLKTGEKIAEQVVKSGEPQRLRVDRDRVVNGRMFDSLISAPLVARNEAIGALNIYNKESGDEFNENDESLLTTLAGQAAISISNAMLYKQVGERERMKKELEIARSIQKELRPSNVPSIENLILTATMKHADEVGSDFLDFYPNSDGSRVVIAIGNVFTKGVEAQIIKMMFKTVLQCLAGQIDSPQNVLAIVNEILAGNLEEKELMALFYAIWEARERKLIYANAGHQHPLLYRAQAKTCEKLEQRGRLIGKYNDFELLIKDSAIALNENDKVIFFTPGILNAKNANGNSFGEAQMLNIIRENGHLDAPELRKLILDALEAHVGNLETTEDITILVIEGR